MSTSFSPRPSGRTEQSPGGGAASIEIAGFPQVLYTRTHGDPDALFAVLLEAGREAHRMVERVMRAGENRDSAAKLSGTQLVSTLLRNPSFSLAAKGMSHENVYSIDLSAGTLHVHTRLYAVVSRRTSFFKVEIAGNLAAGPFVVRNPVQGTVIMQVEEERLRQPGFFGSTLAQECLRAQMEQEQFGRFDESFGSQTQQELRMVVATGGLKIPVVLRQKEEGGKWEIVDARRQEWVGSVPDELDLALRQLIHFLQELFGHT
ncbi:MAG TPA: hypothetical protein VJP87_11630 [Candidatus Acidoferrales bacterium]|nr:hypothetical protein [Candidatus Acidoferrales bacterium]